MKVKYDKEVDALYTYFKKSKTAKTLKKGPNLFIDVDKKGSIVGLELLDYSKQIPGSERLKVSIGEKKVLLHA